MDKLIFKTPSGKDNKDFGSCIRIAREQFDSIEEISAKTGKSKSFIASKMIEFAIEHTEIEED